MEPKVNNFEFCPKPEIVVHETDVRVLSRSIQSGWMLHPEPSVGILF